MSRPISKKLLVHSVIAREVKGRDADRNVLYGEPFEVFNVRVERVNAHIIGANGVTDADTLTLFVDARNSYYDNFIPFVPVEQMRIDFEGNIYHIRVVRELFGDSNEVHHYEAELT